MKLSALIAIILSLIGLCNGNSDGHCERTVRYNCFQENVFCYEIIVCKEQAHFFYDTFQDCQKGCWKKTSG